MKSLALFIFSIVFSAQSYGFPEMGDQAILTGTIAVNGEPFPAKLQQQLVEQKGDGEEMLLTSQFFIEDTLASDESEWKKRKDLPDNSLVQMILAVCEQQGGVKESIKVPAGTYDTCKFPIEENGMAQFGVKPAGFSSQSQISGFYWIGLAPFALIKIHQVESDEQRTFALDLELSEFTGQ
ncbi:MAG: hypothetical protein H6626_13430 [Pseudobdellovibrionaceae bacterium]|nr:hypothetical protein [Bdellovibrionales bacterium]USN47173.1 MAG: hypothetical protein H6626_13430 [Pseudobdellovibrionaceae bacterium]